MIMTRSAAKFWRNEDLPKEVAYLVKKDFSETWDKVLYADIRKRKTEKQEHLLDLKRRSEAVLYKPGFIWVFYNDSYFFGGWWIYIKTLRHDYAINFRHEANKLLVKQAMQLFPCGVIPINENFNEWAEKFAKSFPHTGFKRKRNQGLVKCTCYIDAYNRLLKIEAIK